uniref:Uncharacterized protein n=1 Tax=Cannabis sativa TaxID=3483 RepID=A0A803QIJ0_CANSA
MIRYDSIDCESPQSNETMKEQGSYNNATMNLMESSIPARDDLTCFNTCKPDGSGVSDGGRLTKGDDRKPSRGMITTPDRDTACISTEAMSGEFSAMGLKLDGAMSRGGRRPTGHELLSRRRSNGGIWEISIG